MLDLDHQIIWTESRTDAASADLHSSSSWDVVFTRSDLDGLL